MSVNVNVARHRFTISVPSRCIRRKTLDKSVTMFQNTRKRFLHVEKFPSRGTCMTFFMKNYRN